MSFYKLTQGLVLEQDQLTSAADFTEMRETLCVSRGQIKKLFNDIWGVGVPVCCWPLCNKALLRLYEWLYSDPKK